MRTALIGAAFVLAVYAGYYLWQAQFARWWLLAALPVVLALAWIFAGVFDVVWDKWIAKKREQMRNRWGKR